MATTDYKVPLAIPDYPLYSQLPNVIKNIYQSYLFIFIGWALLNTRSDGTVVRGKEI